MNRFFIIILPLVVFLFITSCSNRGAMPMGKVLRAPGTLVTEEMKSAAGDSAYVCGFKSIDRDVRVTTNSIIYLDAHADKQNLGLVMYLDTVHGRVVIVVGDNNRGVSEGFDEEGSKKFFCFEEELKKRLPHVFKPFDPYKF